MDFDAKTKWLNPTDTDAKLTLFERPGEFVHITVPAKGHALIPSRYDQGIHDIRNGVIVGGRGPQLRREGQKETIHPALLPPEKPTS